MPTPEDEDWERDPAFAPLAEAGEGTSEGFELAEADLIDHASHGDQRDAGHLVGEGFHIEEPGPFEVDGEPDTAVPTDLGDPDRDGHR